MMSNKTGTKAVDDAEKQAKAGSAQHQVLLARHLLAQARTGNATEQNAKLAVDWLIKASKQGNSEATQLLKECTIQQLGVTEENIGEVSWCLETPDLYKNMRQAARQLYQDIKQDQDSLKKDAYFQRVNAISQNKHEQKFLTSTGQKVESVETVEEDEFVETLARRMRSGQIDPFADNAEMQAFSKADLFRKVTKYPATLVSVISDGVVEFIAVDLTNILMYVMPFDQAKVLIFFFLFSMFTVSWLCSVMSVLTFYTALGILLSSTLHMYQNVRKEQEVKVMAELLSRYNKQVSPEDAVDNFMKNSLRPYWMFFSSMVAFLPSYYLSSKTWIPCSECAVVSLILALLTFIFLNDKNDVYILISFGLSFLASFPKVFIDFPNIPIVYQVLNLLTSSIPFNIVGNLYVNIGIPSLALALVIFLFIKMGREKNSSGIYRTLLPHIVTLLWMQNTYIFYQDATWLGLARGSAGWLGFVIFLPFITISGILYGIYYSITTFSFMAFFKVAVTVILILTPILLSLWEESKFSIGSLSLSGKSLKTKLLVMAIPIFILTPLVILGGDGDSSIQYVTWDVYSSKCGSKVWENNNIATAQAQCTQFQFMKANWTGTVKDIIISEIENNADTFMNKLPSGIQQWLKCVYGEAYETCDSDNMSTIDFNVCNLRQSYGDKCHMKSYESYTFRLTLAVGGNTDNAMDIPLTTTDDFREVMYGLKTGNTVNVIVTLTDNLGSPAPKINLLHIDCLDCEGDLEASVAEGGPLSTVKAAAMFTVNYFVTPLLEYKEEPSSDEKNTEDSAEAQDKDGEDIDTADETTSAEQNGDAQDGESQDTNLETDIENSPSDDDAKETTESAESDDITEEVHTPQETDEAHSDEDKSDTTEQPSPGGDTSAEILDTTPNPDDVSPEESTEQEPDADNPEDKSDEPDIESGDITEEQPSTDEASAETPNTTPNPNDVAPEEPLQQEPEQDVDNSEDEGDNPDTNLEEHEINSEAAETDVTDKEPEEPTETDSETNNSATEGDNSEDNSKAPETGEQDTSAGHEEL